MAMPGPSPGGRYETVGRLLGLCPLSPITTPPSPVPRRISSHFQSFFRPCPPSPALFLFVLDAIFFVRCRAWLFSASRAHLHGLDLITSPSLCGGPPRLGVNRQREKRPAKTLEPAARNSRIEENGQKQPRQRTDLPLEETQ